MAKTPNLEHVYTELFSIYGPQGWWPVVGEDGRNDADANDGSPYGYHPGDYTYPRSERQRFEVCVGAILTQNTAWNNVHQALVALREKETLDARRMNELPDDELKEAIRPSGYYNMKAKKLRALTAFYLTMPPATIPERKKLLNVWGVGPETADSILLYAYNQPHMIIDAYKRRLLEALGFIDEQNSYEEVKARCEADLLPDVIVYQEFHALIVMHGKQYYSRRPYQDPVFGTYDKNGGQIRKKN